MKVDEWLVGRRIDLVRWSIPGTDQDSIIVAKALSRRKGGTALRMRNFAYHKKQLVPFRHFSIANESTPIHVDLLQLRWVFAMAGRIITVM